MKSLKQHCLDILIPIYTSSTHDQSNFSNCIYHNNQRIPKRHILSETASKLSIPSSLCYSFSFVTPWITKLLPSDPPFEQIIRAVQSIYELKNLIAWIDFRYLDQPNLDLLREQCLTALMQIKKNVVLDDTTEVLGYDEKLHTKPRFLKLFRCNICRPLAYFTITPRALVYIYKSDIATLHILYFNGIHEEYKLRDTAMFSSRRHPLGPPPPISAFSLTNPLLLGKDSPWRILWSSCGRYLIVEYLNHYDHELQKFRKTRQEQIDKITSLTSLCVLPTFNDVSGLKYSKRYCQIIDLNTKQISEHLPLGARHPKFYQNLPDYFIFRFRYHNVYEKVQPKSSKEREGEGEEEILDHLESSLHQQITESGSTIDLIRLNTTIKVSVYYRYHYNNHRHDGIKNNNNKNNSNNSTILFNGTDTSYSLLKILGFVN